MSYILDALRKAERERGIKQVPTVMTNHGPRTVNRYRIWAILSILVVCVAAAAWYFAHSQKEYNEAAKGSEPNQNTASNIDSSASISSSPMQPAAIQKPELPSEKSSRATIAPETPVAIVPRNAPVKKPPEEMMPLDEEDLESLTPEEIMRYARPKPSPAVSENGQTTPASLQEAVGKMTLSLLMFADAKEERMVFIDGDKYAEGDYVEGIYLLESITMDGAVLSYQGERALLKPKSK